MFIPNFLDNVSFKSATEILGLLGGNSGESPSEIYASVTLFIFKKSGFCLAINIISSPKETFNPNQDICFFNFLDTLQSDEHRQ